MSIYAKLKVGAVITGALYLAIGAWNILTEPEYGLHRIDWAPRYSKVFGLIVGVVAVTIALAYALSELDKRARRD